MPAGLRDSSLTRVRPFFTRLFLRDPSGRIWLPKLLEAISGARERLGDLVESPGSLLMPLSVPTARGHLGCFEFPVAPPRELLAWFIDHSDRLSWPEDDHLSRETVVLRRALIDDEPPGSREKARERAREALETRSPLTPQWWRFEGMSMIDCVLITDRLVVTVEGKRHEPLASSTAWYPHRSQLVRTLEAARTLSEGQRQWASLLLSEEPLPEGSRERLERDLPLAAPHLSDPAREELAAAYLGNLTWRQACDAVGVSFSSLPDVHDGPSRNGAFHA